MSQNNSVQLQDGSNNLISQHNSISAAYDAIPATISQAYVIEIMSTYTGSNETYPIDFIAKTGASAVNTITLRPDAAATSATIATTASGSNVLELNDADYIIIDGRAGGTGSTVHLTIENNSTTTGNSNTIELYNGACHNIIQYCEINNNYYGGAARNIAVMESNNPTGNSDNLFQFNVLNCGRYGININGSSLANANRRNTIYGCTFINPPFTAVWIQSNSSNVTIDSCEIYCTSGSQVSNFGVILYDAQLDTAIVTKTTIRNLNNGGSTFAAIGINVRSVASGSSSYIDFTNNFISLNGSGINSSVDVVGIEFAGTQPFSSRVSHNTILIGGTCTGTGTSGNVGSAAVQNLATSTSNEFEAYNNIYVNERTGGTTGLQHLSLALINTNGTFTSDHNTYSIAGAGLARLGTTLLTTLAAYQTAVSPNDANANTESVSFVSATDLHLSGASVGNTSLFGTANSGVEDDIDNEPRVVYYRGADEAIVIDCSGVPSGGSVDVSQTLFCEGDSVLLTLNGQSLQPGISLQWQSRTAGTGTFSNMVNDTNLTAIAQVNEATEYRVLATCSFSAESNFSDTGAVDLHATPGFDSTTVSSNFALHTFTAFGVTNETGILWDFGDGNTSTNNPADNVYFTQGSFEVVLHVYGVCDTVYDTILVNYGCNGAPEPSTAESSTSGICKGDDVNITLNGYSANQLLYYALQWQASTDGVNFVNMPGNATPNFTDTPDTTTYYRCRVRCSYSGDSTFSSTVMVNVTSAPQISNVHYNAFGSTNPVQNFGIDYIGSSSNVTWFFPFGDSEEGDSVLYQFPGTGSYEVTVVVSNICGSDTSTFFINILLGIDDKEFVGGFSIYPNPTGSNFTIKTNLQNSEPLQMVITDIRGAQLYERHFASNETLELEASAIGLTAGVYFINVYRGEHHWTQKLVVN